MYTVAVEVNGEPHKLAPAIMLLKWGLKGTFGSGLNHDSTAVGPDSNQSKAYTYIPNIGLGPNCYTAVYLPGVVALIKPISTIPVGCCSKRSGDRRCGLSMK